MLYDVMIYDIYMYVGVFQGYGVSISLSDISEFSSRQGKVRCEIWYKLISQGMNKTVYWRTLKELGSITLRFRHYINACIAYQKKRDGNNTKCEDETIGDDMR